MSTSIRFTARSDTGLRRENNEDSAYAGPRLLALADGMGGHAAGEVASRYVVSALRHLDEDQPPADLGAALSEAMHVGNSAIADHVAQNEELSGMGCTLTALLFDRRRVGLIHVGDSRAYRMRDGELLQLTKDDTYVQSLVDEGQLSADEAHSHPQRSLILKALTGEDVEPTTSTREIRVGDRYLVCSDGLSDPVSAATIGEVLGQGSVDEAADTLIKLALRSGGPDNVTILIADVVDGPESPELPMLVGALSGEAPSTESAGADTSAGRAAAFSRGRDQDSAGAATTTAATPDDGGPADHDDPPPPSGSRWKFALSVVVAIALLAGVGAVSALLIRSNYFVGEDANQVVVKRGISGELFGYAFSSVDQIACLSESGELAMHAPDAIPPGCNVLTLGDLREPTRGPVRAGLPAGSQAEANEQIMRLAGDNLLPLCSDLEPSTTAESERAAESDPTPTTTPRADEPADEPATEPAADPAAEGVTTRPERFAPDAEAPVSPLPTRIPAPGENCRAAI